MKYWIIFFSLLLVTPVFGSEVNYLIYISHAKELKQWTYLRTHSDSAKGMKIHWSLRVLDIGKIEGSPCAITYLYTDGVKKNGCCKKVILYNSGLGKEILLYENDIIGVDGIFIGVNKDGDVLVEGSSWAVISAGDENIPPWNAPPGFLRSKDK